MKKCNLFIVILLWIFVFSMNLLEQISINIPITMENIKKRGIYKNKIPEWLNKSFNLNTIVFIFLLLTFVFFSATGAPVRIYLSPAGNNQNEGSFEKPVASLTAARDLIRGLRDQDVANDTIYIEVMPGEYFMDEALMLSSLDAGTKQSPVVFRGQPNERTVFYGGLETGRFEVVNPDLWCVFIPQVAKYGLYFEQLYFNGERRFRAQTPNRGEFNKVKQLDETAIDAQGGRMPAFSSKKITLYEDGLKILSEINANELDDVMAIFYHSWDVTRKRVNHTNLRDTALYIIGLGSQPWNTINGNSRYVIENYSKALDAPGEWFLQRDGYLYYIPMPGETPENTRCMVPVIEKFVVIQGTENKPVTHIRFENLSFHVAAYHTPVRGNDPNQAAAMIEASVMLDFAQNIDFLNCEIAHTGLHAIWFRQNCSYSKIEHCHLYDLGGGGVKIGNTSWRGNDVTDLNRLTHHIIVHNNIIQHGGNVFPCAVGVIVFHASDNEVTHNDIADFIYTGISAGWTWGYSNSPSKRNKIEFNHIHHLGWGELCDMGGVYTLGASEGTTVSNNMIHHIYSYRYGGWGLYPDEGSYGIVMENNLVYACKDAGFHQHYGKENIIRNNIFALNRNSQLQFTRPEEHLSFTFENNIVYYDLGLLYMSMGSDGWLKANVAIDNNCYWDTRTKNPKFHGNLLFADWQKLGRDKHSIIADPLFVNPQQFDFRIKNTKTIKKINFKPFDYCKAGVYGSEEWIKKAMLSDKLKKAFIERD